MRDGRRSRFADGAEPGSCQGGQVNVLIEQDLGQRSGGCRPPMRSGRRPFRARSCRRRGRQVPGDRLRDRQARCAGRCRSVRASTAVGIQRVGVERRRSPAQPWVLVGRARGLAIVAGTIYCAIRRPRTAQIAATTAPRCEPMRPVTCIASSWTRARTCGPTVPSPTRPRVTRDRLRRPGSWSGLADRADTVADRVSRTTERRTGGRGVTYGHGRRFRSKPLSQKSDDERVL